MSNTMSYRNFPVPASIDIRVEGVKIGAGTVEVSFTPDGGAASSDTIAYTVYTGLKLTGTRASLAKDQVGWTTGWTRATAAQAA
ncbi:MAG: hypothetical protein ACRC33_28450 [Gemmataceae bacterium]